MDTKRLRQLLQEGERAYGAHYFNAPARLYHGVPNPEGALEGVGPMLENDSRLIEAHIQRLVGGRPTDAIVQDLLETGRHKTTSPARQLSPNEKMLARLASSSRLSIHRGNR